MDIATRSVEPPALTAPDGVNWQPIAMDEDGLLLMGVGTAAVARVGLDGSVVFVDERDSEGEVHSLGDRVVMPRSEGQQARATIFDAKLVPHHLAPIAAETTGDGECWTPRLAAVRGGETPVVWDEYDPLLLEAIAAELVEHPVLEAVPRAVTETLAEVYAGDRTRILRRARIMRATPALLQVAAGDARLLRGALAEVFRRSKRAADAFEAAIFAGAVVTTLEAAVDRWLDADGETSLGRCFSLAFKKLARLAAA